MSDHLLVSTNPYTELIKLLNYFYKSGVMQEGRKMINRLFRRFHVQGMYRVLTYETTLDLIDAKGRNAKFCKREKVQYLQDNIIAFQDQAWGDGKILIDYQCTPGIPVDRYRSGFKTHLLISRREIKSKGDIDDFEISWKIERGFLKPTGFWGTEISHDTDYVKTEIMFPKGRPPQRITVVEKNRQKTTPLAQANIKQLPDGRWVASWEKSKPTLHEQYIMNWSW